MPSREPELYKDKVEVSLDGRQIFYLFFGGAVIVGMVFVLGVMVGRRVEARGHLDRADTQAATDPLAALDRLEGGSGLSFQGSLRGAEPKPATDVVEKKIAEVAKQKEPEKKPEKKPEPKAEPKPEPKPEVEKKPEPEKKAEVEKKPEPEKKAEVEKKPEPEKKAKFTLQLSSFQDKGEAEAYVQSVKSSGFQAYVTQGDVDGKQYYRVRLGSYRTLDAANDAKADFEKTSKKSALVTKL